MTEPVVSVQGLHKAFGAVEAVRGIDLRVERGEIFAFLGPNGAGKTTTVEILEGYRERDAGEVQVLGRDPASAGRAWRERIGIVLQECRMEPVLTVRETIALYAGYYAAPREVDETIGLVGLSAKADERAGHLSGGQQRRLDVALALIGDPELLFLDEPTTGFDPSARRQAWDVIASLRELGKTIFLTTHFMDEAQHLADTVAIISDGKIVAVGPPNELGGRAEARTTISFKLTQAVALASMPPPFALVATPAGATVEVSAAESLEVLHRLTEWALDTGVTLDGLRVERPSLEDVYLQLTEAQAP